MNASANELNRRPGEEEYFEYYGAYIALVPDADCLKLLESQIAELREFFADLSDSDAETVHAPYTWTIKQVVGHLIDTERVFADRLHRISSGESQPQPAFDQNPYVDNQDYHSPSLKSLVDELIYCRQANLLMVRRVRPEAWNRRGVASGHSISVRALAWILIGHIIHHLAILRKRLNK
jgi:uncharacterized damage-inducible protein DinB